MLKPKLTLGFADFYDEFNPHDNFFLDVCSQRFRVDLSDEPEILIFSCFRGNREYEKYNRTKCVNFFYTGENVRPDFSRADYAISFDYLTTNRNYRWPLYNLYYPPISKLIAMLKLAQNQEKYWDEELFCCQVVSNPNSVFLKRSL